MLKNDHMTCDLKMRKTMFPLQVCKIFLFQIEKPPHVSIKTFLQYMGVFAKLTCIHIFNLQFQFVQFEG